MLILKSLRIKMDYNPSAEDKWVKKYLVFFAFFATLLPLQDLLEFVVLVPEAPYLSTQLFILSAQLLDVVLTWNKTKDSHKLRGNDRTIRLAPPSRCFSRGNHLITIPDWQRTLCPLHLSKRSIIGQPRQQSLASNPSSFVASRNRW